MTETYYGAPKTDTLLSLSRYARFMGIDPIRFFGGYSTLTQDGACDDIWYQYRYQDAGKVSREEVVREIARAEQDIATFIGYWPAPRWTYQEPHIYPQFYNRRYKATNGTTGWENKTISLNYGHVISGGLRATTLITTATRGDDIDTTGDGFDDMAVWTIAAISNPSELKAFFKEYALADAVNCRTALESVGADPEWQIGDVRIRYDSATLIATVYISKSQMFRPQRQRSLSASTTPIDADVAASYVDDLVFYRVYNDPETQAQFLWTSSQACSTTACAYAVQDGCIQVRDERTSVVSAAPGTYDEDTELFTSTYFTQGIEPHKVLVSYYSGATDQFSLGSDRMSDWWVAQVAKLATSRIPRKLCNCDNVQIQVEGWQADTKMMKPEGGYMITEDIVNPFGTRVGEMEVFSSLKNFGVRVASKTINTY